MSKHSKSNSNQKHNPFVTIFVPVFNGQNHLSEAITSLLKQTYTNFELLIIDDGSSDLSLDLVANFTDSRIKLVQNENNMGIASTSNRALEIAEGKYLMRLDADDIAMPDRLAKQTEIMEANSKITVLGTQCELFGNSSGLTKLPLKDSQIKANFLQCSANIANPTSMLRMEFFRQHALRYETQYPVAEDLGFWVNAAMRGAVFANLPSTLIKYRIHANNLSISKGSYLVEALKPSRAKLLTTWFPELSNNEVDIINPLLHIVGGKVTLTKQNISDGTTILERLQSQTQSSWMGEDRSWVFRFFNMQIAHWRAYL